MNIKLQDALLDIAREVEKMPKAPAIFEIEVLSAEFLHAAYRDDLTKQTRTAKALTAALVKWQVEKL
jgi:hypothetical protein